MIKRTKIKMAICLNLFAICCFGQSDYSTYLDANKQEIKYTEAEQFQIFSTDFNTNQIFLFGENHGAADPHDFDFFLFKKLHKEQNVRHYIAEIDPAKAWLLNSFLADGDEKKLLNIFASWQKEGLQWANENNFNKYKKLQQYYKSLPKSQKFTVIGIDLVQDYEVLKIYAKHLVGQKKSGIPLLNKFVNIVDTVQYKSRGTLAQIAREIQAELNTEKKYKTQLKRNFQAFELMVKNVGYVGNKMYRDSIMFRTFQDAVNSFNLQKTKMYGFLGFYHTLQNSYSGSMPFAAHLKNEGGFKKMISMQMLALNSMVLLPYNDDIKKVMPPVYIEQLRKNNPSFPVTEKYIPYELSNDNAMMKVDGIDELKKLTTANSTTVFKLNGADSPYNKGKFLAEVTGFQTLKMTAKNESTLDAFQYVILFRNSSYGVPLLETGESTK